MATTDTKQIVARITAAVISARAAQAQVFFALAAAALVRA